KDGDDRAVVNGLYAVGECACVSVHGANRLGTNSLLDLLVFGRAAGNFIVEQALPRQAHKALPKDAGSASLSRLGRLAASGAGESVPAIASELRESMQAHCGVYRNQGLLAEGVQKGMALAERAGRSGIGEKSRKLTPGGA